MTKDLDAVYPAVAVREILNISDIPMLNFEEKYIVNEELVAKYGQKIVDEETIDNIKHRANQMHRMCHILEGKKEKVINEYLGIKDGETTADGLFTLKNVACLGCCSLSPVMMINDDTYGSLTPEKAISIFKELQEKAGEEEK